MAKERTEFRCVECGTGVPKWAGRCPGCDLWNTMVEEVQRAPAGRKRLRVGCSEAGAVPMHEVDAGASAARPTGVAELDRVLGGGLVPGSVTVLGGEPGIGKSTLTLQAMAELARAGWRCLMVSAEESSQQVRLRADRLGAAPPGLWLLSETEVPSIVEAIKATDAQFVVVDSIQTVFDPGLASAPGSVAQVSECAHLLVGVSKQRSLATVLVGHVTKDGGLAGPRVLEHVVDTVLSFEGERHHALRLLRAVKHRFGSTSELGLFEMSDEGLVGVADPGALFLADRRAGVAGSVVVPTVEGRRPLLVELQALVSNPAGTLPRRWAQGLDFGRLAVLLAVLESRVGVKVSKHDVHAMAAGGVKVTEPGADLALALAVASSHSGVPVPDDVVALGEIGLGGEVRQASQTSVRLAEAARLGFARAIVPASAPEPPPGMVLHRVRTVAEAVSLMSVSGDNHSSSTLAANGPWSATATL